MKASLLFLLLPLLPPFLRAQTTIAPGSAHAYGANIGWIDARGDVTHGAVVGEFVCSGLIYAANVGWIDLGDGTPADGIRYRNNSATDCGVNTQDYLALGGVWEAKLRGYAYGANIGWIAFQDTGNPRVDLATGSLRGSAYSANAGWIALGGVGVNVRTVALAPGADSDDDGIADAWEILYAEKLFVMDALTDSDSDGVLDRDEYAADTNPFRDGDALRITDFVAPRQLVPLGPFLTDIAWTNRPTRTYSIEVNTQPGGAWTLFGKTVLPAAGPGTLLRFEDTPAAQRFYRVRARLPLSE